MKQKALLTFGLSLLISSAAYAELVENEDAREILANGTILASGYAVSGGITLLIKHDAKLWYCNTYAKHTQALAFCWSLENR